MDDLDLEFEAFSRLSDHCVRALRDDQIVFRLLVMGPAPIGVAQFYPGPALSAINVARWRRRIHDQFAEWGYDRVNAYVDQTNEVNVRFVEFCKFERDDAFWPIEASNLERWMWCKR